MTKPAEAILLSAQLTCKHTDDLHRSIEQQPQAKLLIPPLIFGF